MYIYKH